MHGTRRTLLRTAALCGLGLPITIPFAFAQTEPEVALTEPGPLPEKVFGSPDAPVTVIEYASLTCHHCKNFHVNFWPTIKEKYVDTGKVRFIMREFPLDPLATAGFMLARCSGEDKWYPVVDTLYRSDDLWAHAADPVEGLYSVMRQTSMGREAFEACLRNQKLLDDINEVSRRGAAAGVKSTPTFFINGQMESGALSPEQFGALVDPLIEAKN
jgi:protein-disulfide isomerase